MANESTTLSVLEHLFDIERALEAAQQALAHCLDSLKTQAPQAVPLPPKDAAKRRQLSTNWARIGGHDFDPEPTDLFETDEFRKLWIPGPHRRGCYAAACGGLWSLSRILKIPVYKVSTTGADRVWTRNNESRRDRHGALWHNGQAYVEDAGWDDWYPSHLHPQRFPSPGSPVIVQERAIIVPLPCGMDPRKFDQLFDAETRKGALNRWVMTPEGRDHCGFLGVDPAIGQRFSAYRGADQSRISPADELCAFSIYSGADRIIAIAEKILLEAVGLKPVRGAPAKG
ncbi:hypothetical protein [uncultured Rhodoblastus sp.]|uniref:hypothetical protein n=1 Tax=uncultured Rhodoblastus sp. TaxID=543037 RepID=UPI0025F944DD|nr:hypothetical protein [uncultured Rhodoblastus sp.]